MEAQMSSNLQELLDELGMKKDDVKAWAELFTGSGLLAEPSTVRVTVMQSFCEKCSARRDMMQSFCEKCSARKKAIHFLRQWYHKSKKRELDLKLLMQSLCIASDIGDSPTIACIINMCLFHFPVGIAGTQLGSAQMSSNLQELLDELGMKKNDAKAWAEFFTGCRLTEYSNFREYNEGIVWIEQSLKSSTTSTFRLHALRKLCRAYNKTGDTVKEMQSCKGLAIAAIEMLINGHTLDYLFEAYFRMARCFMSMKNRAEALEILPILFRFAEKDPHDPYFNCVALAAKAITELHPHDAHSYYKEAKPLILSLVPPPSWVEHYILHFNDSYSHSLDRYDVLAHEILEKRISYLRNKCRQILRDKKCQQMLLGQVQNVDFLEEAEAYAAQLIELEEDTPLIDFGDPGLCFASRIAFYHGNSDADSKMMGETGGIDIIESLLLKHEKTSEIGRLLSCYYMTSPRQRTWHQAVKRWFLSYYKDHTSMLTSAHDLINSSEDHKGFFQVIQKNLLMHPMAEMSRSTQLAFIWSERGRAQDLKESMGKQLISQQEFDRDDDDAAWSQICRISYFAGKNTAFLVYSTILGTTSCQYFLHMGRVSCKQFSHDALFICEEKPQHQTLFDAFVRPWKPSLERLEIRNIVIIPNEELSTFSFASFCDSDTEEFLVQRYAISYAPSLFVFGQCQQREEELILQSTPTTALIVGNPTLDLKYADKEADFISEILHHCGYSDIKVMKGENATPTNVLNLLPSTEWIHIASHATLNKEFPSGAIYLSSKSGKGRSTSNDSVEQSVVDKEYPHGAIVLSSESDKSGSTSDDIRCVEFYSVEQLLGEFFRNATNVKGKLSGYDIEKATTTLNARGVILSACGTATGQTCLEGVLGLCRSFQMMGVPMLVVSLWPVNDEATHFFMEKLYKNLQEGMHIAFAVQEVMKLMIEEEDEFGKDSYPVQHWAPFIVSGSPYIQLKHQSNEVLRNFDISNLPPSPLFKEYMFDSKEEYQQCKTLLEKLEQMVDANGKVPFSLSQDKFGSLEEHHHYQMLLQMAEASETSLTTEWIHVQLLRCRSNVIRHFFE